MPTRHTHAEAKAEILLLCRSISDCYITDFGPYAHSTLPMIVVTPDHERWQSMAASLESVGLQPEVVAAYSLGESLKFHVKIHVPEHWQRP